MPLAVLVANDYAIFFVNCAILAKNAEIMIALFTFY